MNNRNKRGPMSIAHNNNNNKNVEVVTKKTNKSLSQQVMEEEMKRQCLDLKKQIYNRWEENILTKNFFSPKPQTSSHQQQQQRQQQPDNNNNNSEKETFASASDVTSKVVDEADSDGSVEDLGLEPDSVMSQSQVFPVNRNNSSEDNNNNDRNIQPRVLPSKAISKNAVPPRHAPVKLEESIEPVPQNPSLAFKLLPASPKKDDDDEGEDNKKDALVDNGNVTTNNTDDANNNNNNNNNNNTAIISKDDDADAGAGKEKATPPKRNKNVNNLKIDPPIAARTVSPPLPLYNFKSPVHKPLKSSNTNASNNLNNSSSSTKNHNNNNNNSRNSSKSKVWVQKPPKTGINVPLIFPPPFHVRYVPPKGEPLYIRRPQLVPDMLLSDAERLAKPELVKNRVVYDSIEPNPIKGKVSPTIKIVETNPLPPNTQGPPPPVKLDPYYIVNGSNDTTLVFESRFESGNLRRAIQVYDNEYDLIIKPDINTRGHTQWFYFSVANTRKKTKYKFNMINLYKADSLYNRGMQPLIYSMRDANKQNVGWVRRGEEVCYYQNHIKRRGGYYYTATFTVEFPHDQDTVYLAYCFPYTYSDLQRYLYALEKDPKRRNRFRRRPLCQTLAGNNCDLLTITSFACDSQALKARKGVVVTARVHPGESNSSYMMKGVIDYLTGPSLDAKILRDNFVFKIVPMLNPDGVIVGNYRCSLAGVDLNRNWDNPSRKLNPTIYYTKNMIRRFMEDREVILFTDFHGHSRKMNVFMYGCENRRKLSMRLRERIFPRILWKNSSIFSYADCSFNVGRGKESTGRVVGWKELGLQNSYTMEASFCGADFGRRAERHFTVVQLEEMGHYFCDTILDYCDPDQTKVQNTLRELQALNPSGHSSNGSSSSNNNNNADIADSDGSDDETTTTTTKSKKKSKKKNSGVARRPSRDGKNSSNNSTKSDNNGKKKRMRRRASLPSVSDSSKNKSDSSKNKSDSKKKNSKSNKEKVRSKNKELSVEEALAQADAVLSSLSVAVPPPTRNKSANNEPFTKKKSKMVKRPLSASLIEDTLSKLENSHRKKGSNGSRTSNNINGGVTKSGALRSSLAQAGRNSLSGWGK